MSEDTRYQDYVDVVEGHLHNTVEGHLHVQPEQVYGDHAMYTPSTALGYSNFQPGSWLVDTAEVFPSPLNDTAFYSALGERLSAWDPSSPSQNTYWDWKDSLDGRSVVNDAVPAPEEDCRMEESPSAWWMEESPSAWSTFLDGPEESKTQAQEVGCTFKDLLRLLSEPPDPSSASSTSVNALSPQSPSLPSPSSFTPPVHPTPKALNWPPASAPHRFLLSRIESTINDLGILDGPSPPPTQSIQKKTVRQQRKQEYRRFVAECRDVTLAGSAGLWYSIRLPEACKYCRTRKVKCNGLRPYCELCFVREIECDYGTSHDEEDVKLDFILEKIRKERTVDASKAELDNTLGQIQNTNAAPPILSDYPAYDVANSDDGGWSRWTPSRVERPGSQDDQAVRRIKAYPPSRNLKPVFPATPNIVLLSDLTMFYPDDVDLSFVEEFSSYPVRNNDSRPNDTQAPGSSEVPLDGPSNPLQHRLKDKTDVFLVWEPPLTPARMASGEPDEELKIRDVDVGGLLTYDIHPSTFTSVGLYLV
ncbi:hypothetical protein FA95DRAFT_1671272 [Auriscalpium vulgare]|uniref:Uncharacterized protein n=1 Tax=Auriscalpium vulgare TaxID=40419 RepID=A0ACB8R0P3_9AGAM|nr:hypothetical protein FA95DRAFT_1671272 [Auriscalpium vulgare]